MKVFPCSLDLHNCAGQAHFCSQPFITFSLSWFNPFKWLRTCQWPGESFPSSSIYPTEPHPLSLSHRDHALRVCACACVCASAWCKSWIRSVGEAANKFHRRGPCLSLHLTIMKTRWGRPSLDNPILSLFTALGRKVYHFGHESKTEYFTIPTFF